MTYHELHFCYCFMLQLEETEAVLLKQLFIISARGSPCVLGEACDFDFCEECYLEQLNSRRCTKGHVLVSLGTSLDNGWFCDATKEGGCRSKDHSCRAVRRAVGNIYIHLD